MGAKHLVTMKCHGCEERFEGMQIMSYSRGRPIFFHNQACFVKYLQKNRPAIPADLQLPVEAYQRLQVRIQELKEEVLFNSPNSHRALVDEAIIYEFMFILDGKPSVTIQERLPQMENKVRSRG